MGEFYKKLTTTSTIANMTTSVFANPASKTSYIRLIQLFNDSTESAVIALHEVLNNTGSLGAATAGNKFYNTVFEPGETMLIEYAVPGLILENENDSIQAIASNNDCTISIMGGQE